MTKIANSIAYKKKYNVTTLDDFYGSDSSNNNAIIRLDFEAVANLIKTLNGGVSTDIFIYNEIPVGLINGANATFTSQNNFVSGTVEVYLNGIYLKIIDDYQIIGNNRINLSVSPTLGENLLINYIKQ